MTKVNTSDPSGVSARTEIKIARLDSEVKNSFVHTSGTDRGFAAEEGRRRHKERGAGAGVRPGHILEHPGVPGA